MKNKIIFLLAVIVVGLIAFIIYDNWRNQCKELERNKYSISTNDAQEIITSVKMFIPASFSEKTESGKALIKASNELKNNFTSIAIIGHYTFTIKDSSWLFYVQRDIAHGAYIGKDYMATVLLKKDKGHWLVKDACVFKRYSMHNSLPK